MVSVLKTIQDWGETGQQSLENEIFNDTNINLVSLASYDNHHYSQILKAAKLKKNIFVEKPICLYLKELKKIKMNVEKNKINMSCNFVLREININ